MPIIGSKLLLCSDLRERAELGRELRGLEGPRLELVGKGVSGNGLNESWLSADSLLVISVPFGSAKSESERESECSESERYPCFRKRLRRDWALCPFGVSICFGDDERFNTHAPPL